MSLIHGRKDPYRYEDLQELVRVCGKSILHLPSEYSPRGLVLPTCFRATAHYLVQHMETRGIFRVSGSMRQVNTIYQYYCDANADGDGGSDVTSTTRCPSLPSHLQCGPHEVATAFKKFLGSLPGGILGSLELFDAMVAIHSQLRQSGHPEGSPRTREGSIRARLIAMAIGTVRSRYRRDLICAVLGLLSLIGSRAEVEIAAAPREDEFGNALPSSDHMGYNALGVVFGPLLVGDLLDSYTMKLATPSAGLVLFPMTPPKLRKLMPGGSGGGSRPLNQQSPKKQSPTPLTVDKVHVANNVAEMLIRHWRDVVRHMKSLGVLKTRAERGVADHQQRQQRHQRPLSGSSFFLRPSQSETGFAMRRPTDWEIKNNLMSLRRHLKAPQESPTPVPRKE